MRADWNDAPHYLKDKRQNVGKWRAAVTIGVAFIALSVYVADHKLPLPSEPLRAQSPGTESYIPKYEAHEPTSHLATTPDQLFCDEVNEQNHHRTQPKQTLYTDFNCVPRGATNVADMEALEQSKSYNLPKVASKLTPHTNFKQSGAWVDKWSGGAHYYAE